MTIKELVVKLLDYDLDSEVWGWDYNSRESRKFNPTNFFMHNEGLRIYAPDGELVYRI